MIDANEYEMRTQDILSYAQQHYLDGLMTRDEYIMLMYYQLKMMKIVATQRKQ